MSEHSASYDNTRFNLDEYAIAAVMEYGINSVEGCTDNDVVESIARHVFDGFVDSDDADTFKNLRAYFDAADSWCGTVGEFDDEQEKTFLKIGRELLSDRLVEIADDLPEMREALNAIQADVDPDEKFEMRVNPDDVPCFGGGAGEEEGDIWSWDEGSLLVRNESGLFEIKDRAETLAV